MAFEPGKKFAELASRKRRPQKQNTEPVFFPPSQGGINALALMAEAPLTDALVLNNLIPQEYGVAVRNGYREWCPPVPLGDGIKTIIPFNSESTDVDTNRLFVATSDGIYEVTTPGAAPIKRFNWPSKTTRAGWCSWTSYTTIAGAFILLCDLENGYHVYTGSTNTWAVGSITGPNPPEAQLDFVMVWKNRVWLVQQNSGVGWYLPVGQITGAATAFEFGNKFKYGGFLKGLYNFTIDGGEGVDDYMVALSEGGDAVLFKGSSLDGNDPDFEMKGVWWLGKTVRNRRTATLNGGDLLVLTSFGVTQMSKIIAGLPAQDEQVSLSAKINPRLNNYMDKTLDQFGWEIKQHPRAQLLWVLSPKISNEPHNQFVYNTSTRAWCQFKDVPALTAESFRGEFFIGAADNRLYIYSGNTDNVLLADSGASAVQINWECLNGYSTLGSPGRYKRVQFMRPYFIGGAAPQYAISAVYDFDLNPPAITPPYVQPVGARWDVGLWDQSVWGGGYTVNLLPIGGSGMGIHVGIYMKGRSSSPTIHVGTDVMGDQGGLL